MVDVFIFWSGLAVKQLRCHPILFSSVDIRS